MGPVREAIASLHANGYPTIGQVAPELGFGVRNLQRRLADSGTSYRQIVDEFRRKQALDLIENRRLSIANVSAALGYSDPAHFSRAFARWTGVAPAAYRRQPGR